MKSVCFDCGDGMNKEESLGRKSGFGRRQRPDRRGRSGVDNFEDVKSPPFHQLQQGSIGAGHLVETMRVENEALR
jgi:hypothetical protein